MSFCNLTQGEVNIVDELFELNRTGKEIVSKLGRLDNKLDGIDRLIEVNERGNFNRKTFNSIDIEVKGDGDKMIKEIQIQKRKLVRNS